MFIELYNSHLRNKPAMQSVQLLNAIRMNYMQIYQLTSFYKSLTILPCTRTYSSLMSRRILPTSTYSSLMTSRILLPPAITFC